MLYLITKEYLFQKEIQVSLKNLIDYILKTIKQIQTSINSNVLHLKDFQAELLKNS